MQVRVHFLNQPEPDVLALGIPDGRESFISVDVAGLCIVLPTGEASVSAARKLAEQLTKAANDCERALIDAGAIAKPEQSAAPDYEQAPPTPSEAEEIRL